jgi:cytochrome c oxidase cbb3-type subunit IV
MDINDFRVINTVLAFVCFISIVIWAYSGSPKRRFEEAANLPFADDDLPIGAADARSQEKGKHHE